MKNQYKPKNQDTEYLQALLETNRCGQKNAAKRLKNGGKLGIILGNPREGYHDQQLFCQ